MNTTSNSTSHSYSGSQFLEYGSVYWQPSICAIGFVFNVINVIIFSKRQFTGSSIYILMTALSSADAITLCLRAPTGILECYSSSWCSEFYRNPSWILYAMYVDIPITNMTENISVWLTVILAVERYVAMNFYSISRTYCTPRNTRALILVVVLLAVVLNMPFYFSQRVLYTEPGNVTNGMPYRIDFTSFGSSVYYTIYTWLRLFIVQLIPLTFLCVFNCLLMQLIHVHNKKFLSRPVNKPKVVLPQIAENNALANDTSHLGNNLHDENDQTDSPSKSPIIQASSPRRESDQVSTTRSSAAASAANSSRYRAQVKLTTLLVAIVCLFIAGQLPQALAYKALVESLGLFCHQIGQCKSYMIYRFVTINLGLMAYSSNFFLYLFLNTHFRNALFGSPCCIKSSSNHAQTSKTKSPDNNQMKLTTHSNIGKYSSLPASTDKL